MSRIKEGNGGRAFNIREKGDSSLIHIRLTNRLKYPAYRLITMNILAASTVGLPTAFLSLHYTGHFTFGLHLIPA